MSANDNMLSIRQWTRDARREPTVRIGIILDEDASETVRLRTPDAAYTLARDDHPPMTLTGKAAVEIGWSEGRLSVRTGDAPAAISTCVRIAPAVAAPLAGGVGVLVGDVVAGRGFHWQKRIDQTLPGTLELRPGARGVVLINELGLEDYLAGVITAEMGGACPGALLEAQCIVARSWLLAMTEPKHTGDAFDRCNDDCCQRYQGTGDLSPAALAAVRATRGRVLLAPNGGVLDANYAKSCGGISEWPRHVWNCEKPGVSAVVDAPPEAEEHRFFPITEANLDEFLDGAWLRSTRCYCSPNVAPPDTFARYLGRVDEGGDYFRWTVTYTRAGLEELLREKVAEAADLAELTDLRVLARGVSGRASRVALTWRDDGGNVRTSELDSEYNIRAALHRKFLYSSAMAIRLTRNPDETLQSVTLRGAGWGHGVGLCQIGALGMALSDIDSSAICRHYYPESTLQPVYE
jgi:peptidoglycan hydrolase-like amidase